VYGSEPRRGYGNLEAGEFTLLSAANQVRPFTVKSVGGVKLSVCAGGGLQEAVSAHSPLALPWALSGLIDGPRQVEPLECCSGFLMT
jgi:hypothetical protein